MRNFLQRLQSDCPIILDGPTGTELTRQGVRTDLPLWSAWGLVEAPEVVQQIHRSYLDAGAEVITANTFRTHRRSLSRAGLGGRARELTRLAVQLARSAVNQASSSAHHPQAGPKAWVAGSIAPLEDCYSPQLVPSDEELAQEHSADGATQNESRQPVQLLRSSAQGLTRGVKPHGLQHGELRRNETLSSL